MNKKLAPELRARLRSADRDRSLVSPFERKSETDRDQIGVIVEFTGNIEDLAAVGFEQRTLVQHPTKGYKIATGLIHLERLIDLANIDHVVEVEGPQRYYPMLNYSLPEIRANAVHTGSPAFKGDGVVIGVIDSGIDWRHGAFKKPDGTSKILAIWDQMLAIQAGETAGPFGVGVLYMDFTDPSKVRTRDKNALNKTSGHGTHVAGIAAGNGGTATCCYGSGTYVGVAPNADLVVVRYDYTHKELGENIRLTEALYWIFNESPAQGKPTVVNISLGINRGAHDGTSEVERYIDAMIAGRTGRAIVVAAGNFADTQCHVEGTVPGNDHVDVDFTVRKEHEYDAHLDLWYDRASTLNLTVTYLEVGGASKTVTHGMEDSFIANPTAGPDLRSTVNVDGTINGVHSRDNNFRITIDRPSSGNIPHGSWQLRLSNPNAGAVRFHCWIERGEYAPVFLKEVNPPDNKIRSSSASTISIPGTAVEAITVANHESRTDWRDCWPSTGIVTSSSRGPVARGAATNQKPDIAAPGLLITAPQADASNLAGNCCSCCPDACCTLYQDMTGTSMAAPHVAGAIALMLEKNPSLTKSQILTHLQNSARPAPAGGTREVWGAGKLDVQAAVNAVPAPPGAVSGSGGGLSLMHIQEDLNISASHASRATDLNILRRSQTMNSGIGHVGESGSALPHDCSWVQILRTKLSGFPEGDYAMAAISRHFSEVRRLINTNRRIATMWHRAEGPRLLRRLLHGSLEASALASSSNDRAARYLGQCFDLLTHHGSTRLRESMERYRSLLIALLAMPIRNPINSTVSERA